MKKGTYQAIFISALIHIIAFAALITLSPQQKHVAATKRKPIKIKSYIYNAPKLKESVPVKESDELEKQVEKPLQEKLSNQIKEPTKQEELTEKNIPSVQPKTLKNTKIAENKDASEQQDIQKPVAVKPKLSALTQLNNLRSKINADIASIPYSDLTLSTSGSKMHGEQAVVPHSNVPLTSMQKKEKNTTRYSDGLAIIKNDNGTCTIEQDLSSVGIEGVTARQSFLCGEDPEKKNFREHMSKVLKKLGK